MRECAGSQGNEAVRYFDRRDGRVVERAFADGLEPFDKIALRERGAVEEDILSDRLDGGWQRNVLQRRAVEEGIVADGLDAGRD